MIIRIVIVSTIIVSIILFAANLLLNTKTKEDNMKINELKATVLKDAQKNINTIYFAGGCFWGVEGYFKRIEGVIDTQTGYANGPSENPSYEEVIEDSGHAETVKIEYDENVIRLEELVLHFLRIINPYSLNKQGNDLGIQYRSGIYYMSQEQFIRIKKVIGMFEEKEGKKTVIEINLNKGFYDAEEYHQNYLDKNPYGYCHISLNSASDPLFKFKIYKDDSKEDLKKRIGELSYNVTQDALTERPFTSELLNIHEKGIYVDIVSGEPLFLSQDKFDSGSGWPSFSRSITADAIEYIQDDSFDMQRVEVRSKISGSHLGHLFDDGPMENGGLRYCINGAALRFIPYEEMDKEGFLEYKVLFD